MTIDEALALAYQASQRLDRDGQAAQAEAVRALLVVVVRDHKA